VDPKKRLHLCLICSSDSRWPFPRPTWKPAQQTDSVSLRDADFPPDTWVTLSPDHMGDTFYSIVLMMAHACAGNWSAGNLLCKLMEKGPHHPREVQQPHRAEPSDIPFKTSSHCASYLFPRKCESVADVIGETAPPDVRSSTWVTHSPKHMGNTFCSRSAYISYSAWAEKGLAFQTVVRCNKGGPTLVRFGHCLLSRAGFHTFETPSSPDLISS
jgi:hypothetical protein